MSSTDDISFETYLQLFYNDNHEEWTLMETAVNTLEIANKPTLAQIARGVFDEEPDTYLPEFLVWVKESW